MANILLKLNAPYLTPIEADEIRAEIVALKPKVHLVMAGWPWLEVRGLTEEDAERVFQSLRARDVRFHVMETNKKNTKARVQVSETLTVC